MREGLGVYEDIQVCEEESWTEEEELGLHGIAHPECDGRGDWVARVRRRIPEEMHDEELEEADDVIAEGIVDGGLFV